MRDIWNSRGLEIKLVLKNIRLHSPNILCDQYENLSKVERLLILSYSANKWFEAMPVKINETKTLKYLTTLQTLCLLKSKCKFLPKT